MTRLLSFWRKTELSLPGLVWYAVLLLTAPAVAADPLAAEPVAFAVASSEPTATKLVGTITCPEGRFIPLTIAFGKPSLLLGNELGYLTLYPLRPGEAVNGIRYDEPANAKTKQYTFKPENKANWYAVAGELPEGTKTATVNLTAVVNGAAATDSPSVAGRLIISLTGPIPPPGPVPPGPGPGPPPVIPDPVVPLPDGRLGLIKASRDGLAKVTNKAKVLDLAKANRSHAAAVSAGALIGAASILNGWRVANNGAAPAADWKPWGEVVSAKLNALYTAGLLPTTAEWAAAFNEIADGLDPRK